MNTAKLFMTALIGLFLAACGSDGGTTMAPSTPTNVKVAAGATAGTATVSFTAPAFDGGSAITGYIVTANPGGATATGTTSPITVTGLAPKTAYTYSVVAVNGLGNSGSQTTTNPLTFYDIVETFFEPMTQPNNSIFTGTFTYDSTTKTVSNLKGSLTESMTMMGPMTTVPLTNQLSSVPVTLGGVDGLLVTTFTLNTINTFDLAGFAPGDTIFYGMSTGALNPKSGGIGNAYTMVFINTVDPTITPVQAQIDKLAYADCTAGGMMGATCMTGTTVAGYGTLGTMNGYPKTQIITKR